MLTRAPRRPLGVSIIALLGGIFGFLGLGLAGEHLPKIIDAVAGVALVVAIILGLAALIVGWGLWTLRRWAYWTTIVLQVLTIIDHLIAWASHHIGTASLIADILIPVIIVVYLLADRNVREAFRV